MSAPFYQESKQAMNTDHTAPIGLYQMQTKCREGAPIPQLPINYFLISQPKHMLCVLKRTVSMRPNLVPKTFVKTDGKKIFTIAHSNILLILTCANWLGIYL